MNDQVKALENSWKNDARWQGVERPYSAEQVLKLRGSLKIEYTLAKHGAERLWNLLHTEDYVSALGALTGNQAVQQVAAGLKAIYLSGWQVAADANLADEMYPDLSLYPANSVPSVVRKINNALLRADKIQTLEGRTKEPYWLAPIVADGEAGFGGALNAHELMKQMIDAGAAAVHFEDQLSSAKKCGHMGGKVLVSVDEFIQKLIAARLAADICDVPSIIIGRTDADGARYLNNNIDERDQAFLNGKRTTEGYFEINHGIDLAIARACAFAPYCDMVWCETSHPSLEEAQRFAEGVKKQFPNKLLSYNCSPSFNWKKKLDEKTIRTFNQELAKMGYKFQFVTLAGFHALNLGMFDLARDFSKTGMEAYANFQEQEFKYEKEYGYKATAHQSFVGANYFDYLMQIIAGEESAVLAMKHSTEEAQFKSHKS